MSSIGNTLKEARDKKAVSLDEVHARIKIHPRVLQLLEEDKFEKLPSPVYVKSFLKSYAEFLELNPAEIIDLYEKHGRKEPEQVLFIKPTAEKEAKQALDNGKNFAKTTLLVVAVLVGGFFAVKIFAASSLWISKHPISFPKKVAAKKTPKPAPAKASPAAEAKPAPSTEWLRRVSQGNFPKISRATALDLNVTATDNVWLRVTCDGKVLFQSILKKGASETWTAQRNIEIWTGNSSNMTLSLNQASLGSPGKGVIKRMFIDREGMRILS